MTTTTDDTTADVAATRTSLAPICLLTVVTAVIEVVVAIISGAPAWAYLVLWALTAPVCFTVWFVALGIATRARFRRQVRSMTGPS